MRLWSIHPSCLDAKGLVALWREGLLAQAVLAGETKGYKNHPQLKRFKDTTDPVAALAIYLRAVHTESLKRGYKFDETKIKSWLGRGPAPIPVTSGQVGYEWEHLKAKLKVRDPIKLRHLGSVRVHTSFYVIEGGIEPWEVIPAPQPPQPLL